MSKETPNACQRETWMSKAKAIVIVIGAATTGISAIIGAVFGFLNHDTADALRTGQEVQVQKAEQRDAKIEKIGQTADAVQDTLGPNLWASWKYLQGVAEDYPTPENKAKAAAAKAAYERHIKK